MKKILILFFVPIALIFHSCENEIHITSPTIITTPSTTYMLDTIKHEVIAEAEIDGEIIDIDKYNWTITDKNGDSINILYQKDNEVMWMSYVPGRYQVEVTLEVDNKSVKEIEIIDIEYNGINIWKFLKGTWNTTGKIEGIAEWKSTFKIGDKGIFSARINEVINGSIKSSLGMVGNDDIPSGTINYFGQFGIPESNNYKGRIRYYDGETSAPQVFEGEISSFKFFNDFNGIDMEVVLTDYLNSEAPYTIYNVQYQMLRIK